jgi:hypothetical protein
MNYRRPDDALNTYRADPVLGRVLDWIDRYHEGSLDAGELADNLCAANGAVDGSTPRNVRGALGTAANAMEGARFGVKVKDAEAALTSLREAIDNYLDQVEGP